MNNNNLSVKEILSGQNAFYNQSNYEEVTQKEMTSAKPLINAIYTHNTEEKVWRITKNIFSVIIFPIGLYRLTHFLTGKIIIPAASPASLGYSPNHANQSRKNIDLKGEWKIKRISVKVDGYTIDATILGKASTLGNGRWVLSSNGNGEFYEDKLQEDSFRQILSLLDGNAIVFNYPGVGSSTGIPNRTAIVKAYCVMLNFLEDQEKGVGANEIIGYSYSFGGGVQGDALRKHELKQGVKYVFVQSRTFSDLSTTASCLTNRLLGFLVKAFGWNMSSVKSSKNLRVPEIIMQTANVNDYTDILGHPEKIMDDGVIPAKASLAKKLLDERQPLLGKKYFMGIPETHNEKLKEPTHLVAKINEMLTTAQNMS